MDPHARKTYYGSRLGFREQPDLSAFFQCHTVNLDRNEIRILYRDLFPTAMKKLNLTKNQILTDGLCYEWPNQLEELHLEDNAIRDLQFVGHWPTHLKKLYLDGNPLEDLALNCPSLEEVSCTYGNLKKLQNLPAQLKFLEAFYNRITTIGKLPSTLEYCNLAYNQLTFSSIFLQPLPTQLKYLNLSGNQLKQIPVNLPDSIEALFLSKNQLVELPDTWPQSLLQLDLSHNRIRNFQPHWKTGQRLQQLLLQNNCITASETTLIQTCNSHQIHDMDNWNTQFHEVRAKQIQQAFRKFQLKKILRQRQRWRKVAAEFMEIVYRPESIGCLFVPESWNQWKH
jgi:Leucine-rich repeat (LRR) protein